MSIYPATLRRIEICTGAPAIKMVSELAKAGYGAFLIGEKLGIDSRTVHRIASQYKIDIPARTSDAVMAQRRHMRDLEREAVEGW